MNIRIGATIRIAMSENFRTSLKRFSFLGSIYVHYTKNIYLTQEKNYDTKIKSKYKDKITDDV